MELQELEMQLEERLLMLEDQLRAMHVSSPYRTQMQMVSSTVLCKWLQGVHLPHKEMFPHLVHKDMGGVTLS